MRFHSVNGRELPGVTTVLSATKNPYSKIAIRKWVDRVGQDIADGIMENSTKRGDQLHATNEAYLLDLKPKAICQQALTLWRLMRPAVETIKQSDYLKVEENLISEEGFAGTPDVITKLNGKYTIVDWKNSRKPKKRSNIGDYLRQVAAYAIMAEENLGIEIEQCVIYCAVCPDQYLEVTDPGVIVEPELQTFVVNKKQLETHKKGFRKRLEQFKNMMSPEDYGYEEDDNLVW